MNQEFTDLTLGPVDEKESYKRSGQFWEMAFPLSGPVPERWAELFSEVWAGARYSPKRNARIENQFLCTICFKEDLQGEHMKFLTAAVERTNAAYRQSLAAN